VHSAILGFVHKPVNMQLLLCFLDRCCPAPLRHVS
jgi:hypothetical protein